MHPALSCAQGGALIRPAEVSDVGDMFRIRSAADENTMTPQELAAAGVTPGAIALAVQSDPCAWVATAGGATVGFAMVDLHSACLFALFVLPPYQGKGIGTRLVRACEDALFSRHATAWLETSADSRAARLYRRLGWGADADVGGGDVRLEKHRSECSPPVAV